MRTSKLPRARACAALPCALRTPESLVRVQPRTPRRGPRAEGQRPRARKTLRDFWLHHANSEKALRAWFQEAEQANWSGPTAIKCRYPSASIIGNDRIVFNIRGNRYRLVVALKYELHIIYVRCIGTHAQYDKIDCLEI